MNLGQAQVTAGGTGQPGPGVSTFLSTNLPPNDDPQDAQDQEEEKKE